MIICLNVCILVTRYRNSSVSLVANNSGRVLLMMECSPQRHGSCRVNDFVYPKMLVQLSMLVKPGGKVIIYALCIEFLDGFY